MEELVLQDKPGLFSRLGRMFSREDVEADEPQPVEAGKSLTIQRAHRYLVTVRRGITTFDDAMDSVRSNRRASGISWGPAARLRSAIAFSASDTTPATSPGRAILSPAIGSGMKASYSHARRYRGGA